MQNQNEFCLSNQNQLDSTKQPILFRCVCPSATNTRITVQNARNHTSNVLYSTVVSHQISQARCIVCETQSNTTIYPEVFTSVS